jgi:hypothetical protein
LNYFLSFRGKLFFLNLKKYVFSLKFLHFLDPGSGSGSTKSLNLDPDTVPKQKYMFSLNLLHFLAPGSRYEFRNRIRIHKVIEFGTGYGSKTLP